MNDGKGYVIPETVDPGVYKCIKVYVPSDTVYIGAFWRAYEFFTSWLAWARDSDHRGKDAAAVWRTGFDMARALWESGEGCEMEIILRQNPANKCQLQQSHDGGDTWTLAFDYNLCTDRITVPPYPSGETGASDAAGTAIQNVYIGLLDIADANCAGSRTDYITEATAYMRLFDSSWSNPAALGAIYDEYCALDEEGKELYKDPCRHADHVEDLSACTSPEGVIEYLNCFAEKLGEWLDDASDTLMDNLNKAAAALTGSGWQSAAAGGGGAGFGVGCGTLDDCWSFAEEEDFGFIADAGKGVWTFGLGWVGEQQENENYQLHMEKTGGFPAGVIDEISFGYVFTGGGKFITVYVNGEIILNDSGGPAGGITQTIAIGAPITSMRFMLEQSPLNSDVHVTQICFVRA